MRLEDNKELTMKILNQSEDTIRNIIVRIVNHFIQGDSEEEKEGRHVLAKSILATCVANFYFNSLPKGERQSGVEDFLVTVMMAMEEFDKDLAIEEKKDISKLN